jgi:hypothetical protein
MPESLNAEGKVSPASTFFTNSQLLQSGIGIPATGPAGRYRWSQISPALFSYDSHLPSKKRLENTFYKNVAQ